MFEEEEAVSRFTRLDEEYGVSPKKGISAVAAAIPPPKRKQYYEEFKDE